MNLFFCAYDFIIMLCLQVTLLAIIQYTKTFLTLLQNIAISVLVTYFFLITRDKSILLLFSSIFLSGNSFFLPIMLKILLEDSILCSKISYIASYLTVTSYTL